MTDGDVELSPWQSAIQKLSFEHDHEELTKRVHEAEVLIVQRLQHLDGNDGNGEKGALAEALVAIRKIQCERLGFPDWA